MISCDLLPFLAALSLLTQQGQSAPCGACGGGSGGLEYFSDCEPIVTTSSSLSTTTSAIISHPSSYLDRLSSINDLASKNYYMLDVVRTSFVKKGPRGSDDKVVMITGGCPDHEYFRNVERWPEKKDKDDDRTGWCNATECSGGGCATAEESCGADGGCGGKPCGGGAKDSHVCGGSCSANARERVVQSDHTGEGESGKCGVARENADNNEKGSCGICGGAEEQCNMCFAADATDTSTKAIKDDWPTCPDSTLGLYKARCGGGGCGSGCGGCGSGCCAATSSCSACNAANESVKCNLYTPTYHHGIVTIPDPNAVASFPLLSVSSSPYREGDYPVGIAVNGVPFYNHTVSKIFDSCQGHVDGKGCHRYHYHMIPTCLLESHGQDLDGVNQSWWKTDDPLESAGGWPEKSDPSPMVGWALDGLPIMGPYDDEGKLQIGSSAGDAATLDECNGNYSASTGRYAYYLTPNPPYVVGCFRGGLGVGTYEDRAIYSSICPANGISSVYCKDGDDDECAEAIVAAMEATEEECALACPGPYFLFQTCPELSGQRWQTYSLTFGILFLLICFLPPLALLLWYMCRPSTNNEPRRLTLLNPRTLILIFTTLAGFSIMFGLLVDPQYTRKVLPPVLVGILYGLRYPCINCSLALLILWLHDLVDSAQRLRRMKEFLPKTKWIFFGFTAAEFVTQLMADILRGLGYNFNWLSICQYFYVFYGVILSIGLATFSALLWRQLRPSKRKYVRRLFACSFGGSIFGLSLSGGSIYDLFFRSIDNGDGYSPYFTFMTTMRSFEVIILFLLWLCAIPSDTAGVFGRMRGALSRSAQWTGSGSKLRSSSRLFKSSSKFSHQNSPSSKGHFSNASSAGGSGRKISNTSLGSATSPKSSGAVAGVATASPPTSKQEIDTEKHFGAEEEEEEAVEETV